MNTPTPPRIDFEPDAYLAGQPQPGEPVPIAPLPAGWKITPICLKDENGYCAEDYAECVDGFNERGDVGLAVMAKDKARQMRECLASHLLTNLNGTN